MNKRPGFIAAIIAVAIVVLLIILNRTDLSVFHIIYRIILVIALLFVLLIVIMMVAARRQASRREKSKKSGNGQAVDNQEMLKRGREKLMELRRMIMRIHQLEVRNKSNEICSIADKILQTLREKPEQIPEVRQFLNYYLPTLGNILTRYQRIESSGVPAEDTTEKITAYLTDIKIAMDKQYANLFADDKLDMTVDMEAMTMAVKRDGLLSDGEKNVSSGDARINLTL